MPGGRALVAMSGGVDSSVSVAILKEKGYDVTGVTLLLRAGGSSAVTYASRVARYAGIQHEVLDLTTVFEDSVVAHFRQDYLAGRTPNPCVPCNRFIKFGALLDYAAAKGFEYLATGHYASVACADGRYSLLRGLDPLKDQSYFLYTLGQRQLGRILFPLGELTKTQVRAVADSYGLTGFVRPDESQDICFIPPEGYPAVVYSREEPRPGDIVDSSGRVLGTHKGLAYYTIGQRHGLGVAGPQPLYVLRLDAAQNRVVASSQAELYRAELTASEVTWVAGSPPSDQEGITAKVRYKSPEVAAEITILHNTVQVAFAEPQWGLAPGQSVVFYRGDEVLGGGVIN